MKELEDKVNEHDKHIDRLSLALEGLTTVTDKMSEAIMTISVLIEKFNNLEINLTESFGRFHKRIESLEETHMEEGCGTLKVQNEKLISLGRSVDTLRDNLVLSNKTLGKNVDDLEDDVKKMVKAETLMWGIGIFGLALISVLSYIVLTLHEVESRQQSHIAKSQEVCPAIKKRLDKLEGVTHGK